MKEITIKVKSATVILNQGTDKILLEVDLPTAFPEMKYDMSFSVAARKGYGAQWCKQVLGIDPKIVNSEPK